MIYKLRRRISILISGVSFAILFLICLILNLSITFRIEATLKSYINTIYESSTSSSSIHDSSSFLPRYFTGFILKGHENEIQKYTYIDKNQFFYSDYSHMKAMVNEAYYKKDDFNRIDFSYGSRFEEKERYYFVFVEARSDIAVMDATLYSSICVSIVAFASITLIGSLLAAKAVAPYEELEKKEQSFLTDASHELKTPLAIISANTDVLDITYPNDEYIQSTKSQIKRLSTLINNMVSLFKSREYINKGKFEEIDLTELLLDSCVPFKPNFLSKGVKVTSSIAEGVKIKANGESLAKLFSILVENATKYVNDNGEFNLKLYHDKKNAYIVFYNTCEHYDKKKLPHIFDRFYSLDESRSREKSGYGIGLSVAKEIIEANNGEIKAMSSTGDDITFFLRFKK